MVDKARLVFLGCGDLGGSLAQRFQQRGTPVRALRRNPSRLDPALAAEALDYTDTEQLRALQLEPSDLLVFTPKPVSFDRGGYEQGYLQPLQTLLQCWKDGPSRRIMLVSSTRVYGQNNGEWVDEETPVQPADGPGEVIAEAERLLLESGHECCVLRFAGIYGSWPNRLVERIRGGEICSSASQRYSNRIHREDCIGFMEYLLRPWLAGEPPLPVYIGVDDCPEKQWQVESWLAQQIGVTPVETSLGAAGANKRCSNRRLRASGYELIYPDYRAGYGALLATAP